MHIALIGDHNPAVTAHRAIPEALALAAQALGIAVTPQWLATDAIAAGNHDLTAYDGFWCVPASPYQSEEGALRAIRFARTTGKPFLGTCGGFQHALLEYARNVLGWQGVGHAESDPDSAIVLVQRLSCSLVEVSAAIQLRPGTRIRALYGAERIEEGYHCNYGLDERYRAELEASGLCFSGFDDAGEVRAMELVDHPFFVATLFQGERAALRGQVPPLATGLLEACRAAAAKEV